ncbi:MAG: response regulator [Acidobacteria bacterium]|nr:response regulator [Acidobacteriota bacterium]
MQKPDKRRVLAVVEDLMFTVKINEAARRAGIPVDFVKSDTDALEMAKQSPVLIILDLNAGSVTPLKLIGKLKSSAATKGISLLGYVSHIQGELKQQAQEAGCDMVMARSAFSQNLPTILKRHAGL